MVQIFFDKIRIFKFFISVYYTNLFAKLMNPSSGGRHLRSILLPCIFYLLPFSSSATHLMGGNISYEYLGETFPGSNQYSYRITLVTFLDCTSPFWGSGFPETSLEIGIYEGNATPTTALPFTTTLTLPLVDSVPVAPPLPSGCAIADLPCIYQITYIETVTLPLSFSGYHLYYERCCRNGTVVNLDNPGGQGMVFSAYIPPTIAVNSSPVFNDMPVPFICVNDTTGILNTATDPDGDLLIFSFEDPYEGEYTDAGNPAIGAFPDPVNVPFPPITWQTGGYNKNAPFGPLGYAFINSFTGYSQYKPAAIGNFVIAVEIKEYRNGNLIGITRRDMQLLVINCPANSTPVLSTSGGSGTTSYSIQEGESLCFPITFTDPNTITVTSTGNIFNSAFTNPPATITSPVSGTGSVSTQFCWNTGCNQGQALPYLFNSEAMDNGCPPKTTPIVYSITVNNFTGPTTITGVNTVCPGISGLSYSTTSVTGATYNWVVTGGTIVSGQGTNAIIVNWGNGPSGNVAVTTSSQFGCPSGPINLPVTFNSAITVLAGTDKSICAGDTVTIGSSPTAPSGTVLVWSPSSGLSNPNIQNPVASPATTTTYIATATNSSGCNGIDSVVVNVNPLPVANAGSDSTICVSDSVQLSATGGGTYSWFPAAGLSNPTISNPVAFPTDTTIYSVIVTSINNCKDTDEVTVFIITDTPADAGADKTICAGDSVLIGGSVQVPFGATISWSPNVSLNNNTILNPNASPATTTAYTLTITTSTGCFGIDSVIVFVNPVPLANAGNDTLICDGDTVQLSASGGGTYQWFPSSGLNNTTISNPFANPLNSTQYVVTVSANNCSKNDTLFLSVFSSTVTVTADTGICIGDTVQLLAAGSGDAVFVWSPAATLSDDSISNPLAFPSDTIEYFVNATDTNNCSSFDSVTLIVNPLPIADAGIDKEICIGDSTLLNATGGATFVWTPGTTLNDDSIFNPYALPADTTTYFVSVTDAKNCSNTDSVIIIVNPLPVVFAGNDTSICKNGTAQLNATGGISFLWSPPTSLNDPSIQNPQANPGDTTKYFVTATDSNSCKGTDSVTVSIFPNVITASADTGMCINDTVQLFVNGGLVFSWTPSATLSDNSISNPLAFPSDTTTYSVNVIDTNSCPDSASVTVIVYPLPVITATNDTAVCFGNCVSLFASGADNFSWSPITGLDNPNIANPISCSNDTIVYFVTGSGTSNLIFNGDFESGNTGFSSDYPYFPPPPVIPPIIMNGQYSVVSDVDSVHNSWNGNDHTSGSGNFLVADGSTVGGFDIWCQSVSVNANTNYSFSFWVSTLHTNNLLSTANIQTSINGVVVGSPLSAPANSGIWVQFQTTWNSGANTTANICLEDLMTGGGVGNDFALDDIVLVNQTSSVCSNTDSVKIIINPLPIAQAGNDTTICEGAIVQLNATGGTNFLWTPASFLDDQNISTPQSTPEDSIDYLVIVSDVNNCSDSDSVTINVNKLPIADAGADSWLCPGDSAQLIATGGNFFSWSPALTLSDPGLASPKAGPSDTTKYFVAVTDLNSCSKMDSVMVYVNGIVPTDAGTDVFICANDSVLIGGSPTSPNGTIFSWTPTAFLDSANISNPMASPGDTTMFYVFTTNDTCSGTDSVQVIVFPLPSIDAGTDKEICMGDTIQLIATGGTLFAWTNGTTLSDDSIPDPFAFPSDTTKYIVNVSDNNGCSKIDSVQIDVNDLPDAEAGPDIEICFGDSAQLNVSGGNIFAWIPSVNLSDDSISNPLAFPPDTTKYFVTILDTNNCSNNDSVTVIVSPLPVINAISDTSVCTGNCIGLFAAGANNFIWSPSTGLDNPNSAAPLACVNDTIVYYVTGTGTSNLIFNGDFESGNIGFTNDYTYFPPPPSIPPIIMNGEYSVVNDINDVHSDWNGNDHTSGSGNFFVADGSTIAGFNVWCQTVPVAQNTNYTFSFWLSTLHINNLLSTANIEVKINGVVIGAPLSAPANSGIWSQFQSVWFSGNNTTAIICLEDLMTGGGVGNDFALDDISLLSQAGFMCSNTDSVKIIVNPLPIVDAGTDKEICFGDSAQLNATGGSFFVWSPATTLSDDSIADPFAKPTDTAKYFVTITDTNTCKNIDSLIVFVNQLPAVNAGTDKEICIGDSVMITASAPDAISFNWFPTATLSDGSIATPFAKPIITTDYIVTISDTNSCDNSDTVKVIINSLPNADAGADQAICIGDTAQLGASGGDFFVWNDFLTLSDDSIAAPFAFPLDTTVYFVNITDSNGCSKIDSVTVIINPLPEADAGINDEICIGDTTQLNASGGIVFAWNNAATLSGASIAAPFAFPLDTEKYFVNVTDANGCSKIDSVQIDVNDLPIISAGVDTNSCKDSVMILGGSPTAPAGSVFLWTPSTNLDNDTIANPTATASSTTMYFVYVTDSNGCKNIDSTAINIFSISTISDTSFCRGDSISLFVVPLCETSPVIYVWSPAEGLGSTNDSIVKASPDSNIVYTVTATDKKGCAETRDITVIANTLPNANFDVTLFPSCDGVLAEFKNKSEEASLYQWIFGDGITSEKENVSHTFSYNQVMDVTLTAQNEFCKDEKNYNENIKSFTDYFNLQMPNVLTPNNDGLNDCFEINSDNKLANCMDLHVFNRWGELMYVSAGNQHTWCGRTFAGEEVPMGTYFYVFDVNGILFKGSVMVIR